MVSTEIPKANNIHVYGCNINRKEVSEKRKVNGYWESGVFRNSRGQCMGWEGSDSQATLSR